MSQCFYFLTRIITCYCKWSDLTIWWCICIESSKTFPDPWCSATAVRYMTMNRNEWELNHVLIIARSRSDISHLMLTDTAVCHGHPPQLSWDCKWQTNKLQELCYQAMESGLSQNSCLLMGSMTYSEFLTTESWFWVTVHRWTTAITALHQALSDSYHCPEQSFLFHFPVYSSDKVFPI